jgi:ubiquinone biosynthesis protein
VHAAVLVTGEKVAVKVMRPGAEQALRSDLRWISFLAAMADLLRPLTRVAARDLAAEFSRLCLEELDFRREARNTQTFHGLFLKDRVHHRAPAVYFDFCGPRVITMEWFEGLWLTEFLAASAAGDRGRVEAWGERGVTPQRWAELLFHSLETQFMGHRMFQADPHPGNVVWMEDGYLGWVDFGMVGWLDEKGFAQQLRLREQLASRRIHGAYEALLSALEPLPPTDLSSFEVEAKDLIRDWISAAADGRAPVRDRSYGIFVTRLFALMRRHGLRAPLSTFRLMRSMAIHNALILRVNPTCDWTAEIPEFLRRDGLRLLEAAVRERGQAGLPLSSLIAIVEGSPNLLGKLERWLQSSPPPLPAAHDPGRGLPGRWLLVLVVLVLALLSRGRLW